MTFDEFWKHYVGGDKDKSLETGRIYAASAWDYQQARIQAAIEVYAGMEGFIPETAAEGYCLRIIEQMNKALQEQTP